MANATHGDGPQRSSHLAVLWTRAIWAAWGVGAARGGCV
jgi:hypothetical protein